MRSRPKASDNETASMLRSLEETLAGLRDVDLVLLFGSNARGEARHGSDVDLAYLGDGVDVLRLTRDLSQAFGREVDLVDLRSAGYPLLQAVLRDGKPVHEGRPGALARWRSRTITQLEMDRPWFERMRDAFLRRLAEGAMSRPAENTSDG